MREKFRTAAAPKKVKAEWQKYYNRLLELRDQLLHQMNGLAKESAQELAGYSLHMADSGTDNFDRDFALSLLSSDQDAVYEIEEALKRIEKKTYGVCELTGKPIPRARLEAIPWTRFTVKRRRNWKRKARCASAGSASWARLTPPASRKLRRKMRSRTKSQRPRKRNNLCRAKSSPSNAPRRARKANRLRATPPSRNKKLKTEKLEIKKYNPALRRHTLHREIK